MIPIIPTGQSGTFQPVTQAFPGWSVFLGTNKQTQVWHNNPALGSSAVGIVGPNANSAVIEGQFTAVLQAGLNPMFPNGPLDVSIHQTGLVPSDAQSLSLKVRFGSGFEPPKEFIVSFNGQAIPIFPISTQPLFTLYGADTPLLAGQLGELAVTAKSNPALGYNWMYLDSIAFSPNSIPEPSVTWLLAAGLLGTGAWRWRRAGGTVSS